jgi:hypothetical protein
VAREGLYASGYLGLFPVLKTALEEAVRVSLSSMAFWPLSDWQLQRANLMLHLRPLWLLTTHMRLPFLFHSCTVRMGSVAFQEHVQHQHKLKSMP